MQQLAENTATIDNNPTTDRKAAKPFHKHMVGTLKRHGDDNSFYTDDELKSAQDEFRGMLRSMLCIIPKGHSDLREAIRTCALMINMSDDPLTSEVIEHIENERERVAAETTENTADGASADRLNAQGI